MKPSKKDLVYTIVIVKISFATKKKIQNIIKQSCFTVAEMGEKLKSQGLLNCPVQSKELKAG